MLNLKIILTKVTNIILTALFVLSINFSYAANQPNQSNQVIKPTQALKQIGQGTMSWLFFDVYQAVLYSQTGTYVKQDYPQALKIVYKRDIKSDDLVTATAREWQKLAIINEDYQGWLTQLLALWPDIKTGDELIFLVDVDGIGYFYHNNQLLGGIESDNFANAFLSIWLSNNTSEPGLRKQLIGEKQ